MKTIEIYCGNATTVNVGDTVMIKSHLWEVTKVNIQITDVVIGLMDNEGIEKNITVGHDTFFN